MFNREQLKTTAKSKIEGKWPVMISIAFIYIVLQGVLQYIARDNILWLIPGVIISGPLALSLSKIGLNISRGEEAPKLTQLLYGFKHIIKAIGVYGIITIATYVGIILLIVPGIIISLMFSQAGYVLADNPEVGIIEALKESCRLTKGCKWEIFALELSFLGVVLLSVLTAGILLLWIIPHMQVTFAELYLDLKNKDTETIAW